MRKYFRKSDILSAKRRYQKMDNQIYNILNDMSDYLNVSQMKKLQEILIKRLEGTNEAAEAVTNDTYLEMFLTAKQIEGVFGQNDPVL